MRSIRRVSRFRRQSSSAFKRPSSTKSSAVASIGGCLSSRAQKRKLFAYVFKLIDIGLLDRPCSQIWRKVLNGSTTGRRRTFLDPVWEREDLFPAQINQTLLYFIFSSIDHETD